MEEDISSGSIEALAVDRAAAAAESFQIEPGQLAEGSYHTGIPTGLELQQIGIIILEFLIAADI
jgi:hypothetical protein